MLEGIKFTICAWSVRQLKLNVGVGPCVQKAKLSGFMVCFLSFHSKFRKNDREMTRDKEISQQVGV